MPTVGTFHTHYWTNQGDAAPPAPAASQPMNYPYWQVVIVKASGQ